MLSNFEGATVHLACGATDIRKSIDGLAALVVYSFNLDLFSNSLFVFCNRDCDKIKILHWDNDGFWLYYKRLERGRFPWPTNSVEFGAVRAVIVRQLRWLLGDLSIERARAYRAVKARIAA